MDASWLPSADHCDCVGASKTSYLGIHRSGDLCRVRERVGIFSWGERMTAEEIREEMKRNVEAIRIQNPDRGEMLTTLLYSALYEIAAQLAELNERFRLIDAPLKSERFHRRVSK